MQYVQSRHLKVFLPTEINVGWTQNNIWQAGEWVLQKVNVQDDVTERIA
jgi:hypothetical protein